MLCNACQEIKPGALFLDTLASLGCPRLWYTLFSPVQLLNLVFQMVEPWQQCC